MAEAAQELSMSETEVPVAGNPVSVLIVTQRLDIGGTEKHLVQILPELNRRGINASLFVLERGGRLEARLLANGVRIYGSESKGIRILQKLRNVWDLMRHLRAHRPDVIHFFLPQPYMIGSLAAMLARCPRRIMSRRSLANYHSRHPLLAKIEMWMHRRTVALLGNSSAVVDELIRECGSASKVSLIYNGLYVPPPAEVETRVRLRTTLNIPSDSLVLIIVANLIVYKGHEDLLDALAIANPKLPPGWRLLVVGRDDGTGAWLRTKAQNHHLQEHVVWLGEREQAETLFEAADIAVLTSHEEGFSNSLIEAMSRGLPTIATAVGGNLDAIEHEQCGILVPPRSPPELAEAITRLAADADLRLRLGQAARRRVAERFSLQAAIERYINLYRGSAQLGRVPVRSIVGRLPIYGTGRPRISVVMPILDRQELGERALRSVVDQNIPDMEIIVIDDGSERPFKIPPDLTSRNPIQLIRHEENRGAAAARNTGIQAARGDWIALLDSDDYWLPETLWARLEDAECHLAATGDPLTVYAAGFVLDNKHTRHVEARIPLESADPLDFASGCWFSPGSTILMRRETFFRVGPYDSRLRRLEDLDWFLRLSLCGGRLKVWDEVVAVIETGVDLATSNLEEAASHMASKYLSESSAHRLPAGLARHLNAYLHIERAAAFARRQRWVQMSYQLLMSFVQVPRLTVHVGRFWRFVQTPAYVGSNLSPS